MRSQAHRQNETRRTLAALSASRYWRAAEAEQVLAAWQRSGQSVTAFARRHGMSERRLLRWRARLQPAAAPVFHPVRVVERTGSSTARSPEALELELRGGRRVRVGAGFDPELLEALVRTVEGWGC
jgi:transposase-like protein